LRIDLTKHAYALKFSVDLTLSRLFSLVIRENLFGLLPVQIGKFNVTSMQGNWLGFGCRFEKFGLAWLTLIDTPNLINAFVLLGLAFVVLPMRLHHLFEVWIIS
jgi:hypothetical protein